MSQQHPIVAVTGASGAGTTVIKKAFADIFLREGISAAFVDGECFRRYDREGMRALREQLAVEGRSLSPYGPEVNRFDHLEALFKSYSETGKGEFRRYISQESAGAYSGVTEGTFAHWEQIPEEADLLFYEGLHGGVVADHWTRRKMSPSHNPLVIEERRHAEENKGVDVAQYVDLLFGVVPVVNLEWIQKITRNARHKGYSTEASTANIVERMQDYIHFVVPQFSVTDINFQRVPIVDTSNPFVMTEIPKSSECLVVIRFRDPARYNFPALMRAIDGASMSRPNTMVIPGREMKHAMDVICTPLIHELVQARHN